MRIEVNGVGLEVSSEGSGPAVLLLHGFPDAHELWRHQVPALTAAGFRTIAPDLRGFGASDKPGEYGVGSHIGDLLGVLDQLDVEGAHVVGHDWGAGIGWVLASLVPDRVRSLTALSVGHPAAFARGGLAQREKSWYMLLFQFEGVAEQWLSADDFANFREWSGHPDFGRGGRSAGRARRADGGAGDLPGVAAAVHAGLVATGVAAGHRADARGLVERGPLPARRSDGGVRGVRGGAVAVCPGGERRALDAARPAGRGEPVAAGLPRPGANPGPRLSLRPCRRHRPPAAPARTRHGADRLDE